LELGLPLAMKVNDIAILTNETTAVENIGAAVVSTLLSSLQALKSSFKVGCEISDQRSDVRSGPEI